MDITYLLKYIENIPEYNKMKSFVEKNNLTGANNLIAFRGELIISKDLFSKKWEKVKKNMRNTVSGLVNSKTVNPELAKDTSFVAYELVDPFLSLKKQFDVITKSKLEPVNYKIVDDISFELLSEYFISRRKKSTYDIDGIVVSNNENHKRNTSKNPDYAFAFKDILEDQKAITDVVKIEWNISKDGYIIPTVVIKKVEIGGVSISRVSAFNAKYVVDNKLGKGAKVELIRSGDVIPKITKIIKSANKTDLPDMDYHWNETNVDIIIDSLNNDTVMIKNIHFFFDKLDTKGMGLKTVEKLYQGGFNTVEKILAMSKEDVLEIDTFKEKSAVNLITSIKKSLQGIELYIIMGASNKLGHGMGRERMKMILDNYPSLLEDYKKWNKDTFVEKIKEIPQWEEKTALQFVDNFPNFIKFYNTIKKYIKLETKTKKSTKKSTMSGKTIVLSGFKDKDLQKSLLDYNIKVSNSISKNVDLLVVKDDTTIEKNTGKVSKAKSLNIKIVTKDKLNNILNL